MVNLRGPFATAEVAATDDVDASGSIALYVKYCHAERPGSLMTVAPLGAASELSAFGVALCSIRRNGPFKAVVSVRQYVSVSVWYTQQTMGGLGVVSVLQTSFA